MQIFGGVIVATIAVIVVAVLLNPGNGTPKAPPTGPQAARTFQQVKQLLNGIPQRGTVLGNPGAKVTMTYFGDLECPYCMEFTLNSFPQFVQSEVRSGKVKVQYRSLCTATCNSHPESTFAMQQIAAYAAGRQDMFWEYAELFYHEQQDETTDYVNRAFLNRLAGQIPTLKLGEWRADRTDPAFAQQLSADNALASRDGIRGTPTIVMAGPKHTEIVPSSSTVPTDADLAKAVAAVS